MHTYDDSLSVSDVLVENYELTKKVENLDIDTLTEECEEFYRFIQDEEIEYILYKYWTRGDIDKEELIFLKNYYILLSSQLCLPE